MSLRYYAQALRKHWISIVVAVLLGAVAAVGATALMKPTYDAEATGLVHLNSSDSQQSSTFAQNLVQSFPSYVHSPDVLNPTISALHLKMTAHQLDQDVSATNPVGTFNLTVAAQGDTARDAQRIANGVADNLAAKIESLENPAGTRAASRTVTVNFAVPATLPTSPSSPRPKLNLALGLLIGLAIGICLAIMRDQLDTTVKTTDDLSELTGATPLGSIRYDQEFRSRPLVAMHAQAAGIEDFRTIRTNLQFVDVDDPPRRIVISSAIANEGKSVAACNIATTLAQADLRVCLVEGDLRRPRATSYLGLDGTLGLTDVAAGTHSLEETLIPWRNGQVAVLPAGTTPPDPAQFLGSKAMESLLNELGKRYDVVIIDAPPLLPVSDAAVLGALSDGVLLVVRRRHVRKDQIAKAIGSLAAVNARLLGSVLTHVPVARQERGYGPYGALPKAGLAASEGHGPVTAAEDAALVSDQLTSSPSIDVAAERSVTVVSAERAEDVAENHDAVQAAQAPAEQATDVSRSQPGDDEPAPAEQAPLDQSTDVSGSEPGDDEPAPAQGVGPTGNPPQRSGPPMNGRTNNGAVRHSSRKRAARSR